MRRTRPERLGAAAGAGGPAGVGTTGRGADDAGAGTPGEGGAGSVRNSCACAGASTEASLMDSFPETGRPEPNGSVIFG